MAFRKLAAITVATSIVNSLCATIALALEGFSYMSFAWASVISSAVGMLIGFYVSRSDFSIFRPLLRGWPEILAFSACNDTRRGGALFRLWEIAPFFHPFLRKR